MSALEVHVIVPVVAQSRTVPAALFFLLGLLPPAYLAVPAAIACAIWIPAMVRADGNVAAEAWVTAAMAAVAGAAVILVRRKAGRLPETRDPAREAIAQGRSMVLPWEETADGTQKPEAEAASEAALLRREIELRDGVRRSLETVLPLTGASHTAYLLPSQSPGSAHLEGVFVASGGREPGEFIVPESYLPVREATVFRRPFLRHLVAIERIRDLDQDAGTVAAQRVGTHSPAVIEVMQNQQRLLHQGVTRPPLDVRHQADSTGVVFVGRRIQPVAGVFDLEVGGVAAHRLESWQVRPVSELDTAQTALYCAATAPHNLDNRGLSPIRNDPAAGGRIIGDITTS